MMSSFSYTKTSIAALGVLFVASVVFMFMGQMRENRDSEVCPPAEIMIKLVYRNHSDPCRWTFDSYAPSQWETAWASQIQERRHKVCEILANEVDNIVEYMRHVIDWSDAKKPFSNETLDNRIFSRMIFHNNCTNQYAAQVIEPLVGMLRDPVTICPDNPKVPSWLKDNIPDGPVQSKRFNLFAVNAPFAFGTKAEMTSGPLKLEYSPNLEFGSHDGKRVLYDLGANFFHSWGGDTSAYSTAYFYLLYQARQISFDRIFAYEYVKLDPHQVWDVVPNELINLGVYTMINHGVEKEVGNKFNPWTSVKKIIYPEDHLVFKLDIDTPHIENELIKQLMEDPHLSSLVDEMFFEHHVFINEMSPYWGIREDVPPTLATTYEYYTILRRKGIRMHSWP